MVDIIRQQKELVINELTLPRRSRRYTEAGTTESVSFVELQGNLLVIGSHEGISLNSLEKITGICRKILWKSRGTKFL